MNNMSWTGTRCLAPALPSPLQRQAVGASPFSSAPPCARPSEAKLPPQALPPHRPLHRRPPHATQRRRSSSSSSSSQKNRRSSSSQKNKRSSRSSSSSSHLLPPRPTPPRRPNRLRQSPHQRLRQSPRLQRRSAVLTAPSSITHRPA